MGAGGMLQDAKGMTLYTWDNDKEANKSSCNGMCLMNWPALKADAAAKDMGEWKVITRDDGSKQWAYKGKPLYISSWMQLPASRRAKAAAWSGTSPRCKPSQLIADGRR